MFFRYLMVGFLVFLLLACSTSGSPAPAASGTGLSAEYFQSNDLSGLKFVQTDSQIYFDWGSVEPALGMRPGKFSARWTGWLEAPKAGSYTFYLSATGQAKLFLDGQAVITAGANSGTVELTAGKHEIRIEFAKTSDLAALKLEWASPDRAKEVVPRAYLYPATTQVAIRIQAVPVGQNLLLNPDFEGGTGAWIAYGSGTYKLATPGRSGAGQAASATNWAWVQQDLPASSVEAGSSYTLEVWGRSVGGKACTAGFAGGTPGSKVFQKDVSFLGGWEKKSTGLTLPSGTTWLSVYFSSSQPECQFDDFSILVGGVTPPPPVSNNLLLNGDFEAGTNPWDIIGGSSSLVAGRTGGSALQGSSWVWVQQNLPASAIQAGATLTLQAWAKATGGTCTVGFAGGTSTTVSFSRTLAFQANTWAQQSLTQQIPSGTQWMAVYLTTTQEACQFDDLSLGDNSTPAPTGNGLAVRYYDNLDFTGANVLRTVPNINFDWGNGSPDPTIGPDTFSARFYGQIQPQFSETYTFYATTDDGVRLWINNQLIIDKWVDQSPTEHQGQISLSAGQKYTLRLDYYENAGGAQIKLNWSSPSLSKQVVPQSVLYSDGTVPDGGVPSSPAYTGGAWSNLINFPLIPVAAANLPDGRILMWSAYDRFAFGGGNGYTQTAFYNPANGQVSERTVSNTQHDMFCPGTAMLSDGRVFVTGGSNAANTSIYNPSTDVWTRDTDLNLARGYNTAVTLFDGRVLTLGGTWSGPAGDKYGEIWTPGLGWKAYPGASATPLESGFSDARGNQHAWLIPSPDGRVLAAGPSPQMQWYSFSGNGSYTSAGTRSTDVASQNAIKVTYDVGKELKAGGAASYDPGTNVTNLSYMIDINNGLSVRQVASMQYARAFANSVVMPNGEVLVIGGNTSGKTFSDDGSILTPEVWNAISEKWRRMNNMQVARNYHSVALLLPDGRVFSAGGGLCGTGCAANHPDGQIFSPPYLFNPDGTAATRPQIQTAPASVGYGQSFNVSTDGPIARFALIRMSTVTHSVNTDQRFINVAFSGSSNYTLTAPTNAAAVPGNYMLFALSSQGVPSVAKVIRVGN